VTERNLHRTGEAARALGIAASTLRAAAATGRLRPAGATPGRHYLWDLDDLERQMRPVIQEACMPASTPESQPVVAAIVTSHLGVLVGRRHDKRPPWTFIAGEIEPGESQLDAAVREVKEETGLRVRAGRQEIGRRIHPVTKRLMIYLACTPTEGTDIFVGDPDELAEVRWADLAFIDEVMGQARVYEPVWDHLSRVLA
jgi:8-oxo-dGTP pyrophosphatase MutT (NUDIX family)